MTVVWTRWAAAQRAARGLSAEQAQLLTIMAAEAQQDGSVVLGVRRLAELYGRSVRTTERRLAELEERGLFATCRKGSEVAWRALNGGAAPKVSERPEGQMDMLSTGPNNGRLHAQIPARDGGGSAKLADGGSATPWDGGSDPPRHGVAGVVNSKQQQQNARENDEQPLGLADTFEQVLDVLRRAPLLVVAPGADMAINNTLLGRPEDRGFDHLRAAHDVAAFAADVEARGGRLDQPSASWQLARALDRQLERRPHTPRRPDRAPAAHGSVVQRGDALLAELVNGRGAA